MSGLFVPNLLSHFRFGLTWSEIKTLPILLESLCAHSRAHASFFREALAFPPSPPWNVPSFAVESTLFSPCSRSDPPSLTLTLSPLTIWCSGQKALFFSFWQRQVWRLAKELPTALSVAFFFSAGPVCPSFLLNPTSFCKLVGGLSSTNKSATSLLLYDSRCVLSSIFLFTSISLAGTVFSLLLFYQAAMGPRTLVSPGERRG